MYDAARYRQYKRKIIAKCVANEKANKVLRGKDPLAKFLKRNVIITQEIRNTGQQLPTKDDMIEDPRKTTDDFIEVLEDHLSTSDLRASRLARAKALGVCC